MTALPKRFFTPEEYLLLEDQAEYKSQYVDGEIFAMAGAEPEHVAVMVNVVIGLGQRFRGRSCQVFSSDMRVRVKPGGLWTYPDAVALCGELRFDRTDAPATLLNPQVIFEVLSPSTAAFDRGDKFNRYRMLDTLTDYVLIAVDRMRVEHHALQSGGVWKLTEYRQPTDAVPLIGLGCELPLVEIYDKLTFPSPPTP